MHKKMSYRRYERLLLTKTYTDNESTKIADGARSVTFQENVTEIPKSVSPEKSSTTTTENNSTETKSTPISSSKMISTATSRASATLSSKAVRVKESTSSSSSSTNYVSYTSRFRESVAAAAATSAIPTKAPNGRETKDSNTANLNNNASDSMSSFKTSSSPTHQPAAISSSISATTNSSSISFKSLSSTTSSTEEATLVNGTSSSSLRSYIRPKEEESNKGKYVNWSTQHAILADQPWCCIGDLMNFCDKYEFKTIALHDTRTHIGIVAEVTALLKSGTAPFDMRKRFPGNIHEPENLWVCIGRCAGVEYHLKRILSTFRKPLDKLLPDKQRVARQNFHLSINELRLGISARISEVRLYDRHIFEKDFNLKWEDNVED